MIRAGCNCNPGACHNFLGLSEGIIVDAAMQKTSCGDEVDQMYGRPLGAVRVSFGYPTTLEEVDRFVDFLVEQFVDYEVHDAAVFA